MLYKRTQIGYFPIIFVSVFVLLVAGVMISLESIPAGLWLAFAFLVICLIHFSSLTIMITEKELVWYFGTGLWKHRLPLHKIRTVAVTRLLPADSIGFIGWHHTKGWLYSVSWSYAVNIVCKDGKTIRIGTPEPQSLLNAIERGADRYRQSDIVHP